MLSQQKFKRREFLALSAAVSLPGLLAACNQKSTQAITPTPTTRPTPRPTQQPTSSPPDWTALSSKLQGILVRPGSSQYPTALQLFDPRFDSIHPTAIAYCASAADVQQCLAFVRRYALPFTVRSGGHSYAGYSTSTGLVIDVTRLKSINVNAGNKTATIGAGARLIDVYAALAQQGLVLPAGSCPTVGVAGLTLGGGVGVIGRKFGLTSDSLLSAEVALPDGRVITCDNNHDADLFWALRGGGGGNFGAATSFTFRVYPVSALTIFTLGWPWSQAANVLNGWQQWAPQTPDEIWSNCLLLATADKGSGPIVRINGVYVGDAGPLEAQLQQLINKIGSGPSSRYVAGQSILNTMLYEAGCYGKSVNQCHLPTQDPQGQLQREVLGAKSDYFTQRLPSAGINALVSAIATRQASSTLGEGGFGIDSYGGAINRIAPDATAFAHRNALFSIQYNASWNTSDTGPVVDANKAWLNGIWQTMRPYASGAAYQNYIDPDLADWKQAYYGSNLPRLQRIKKAYDPDNLFHFAQSIPPA